MAKRLFRSNATVAAVAAVAMLASSRAAQPAQADDSTWRQQVSDSEANGDLRTARATLQRAAAKDPNAAAELAAFDYRHQDADTRTALLHWADADSANRQTALRQAVLLDFETGNRQALDEDLQRYQQAGGSDLHKPVAQKAVRYSSYMLPGPLTSFARMAALSQDVDPEDVLPSLARNLVTGGYQASGNEMLVETEYLKLLKRYLVEARELQGLANAQHKIVIPSCDSEQTGDLLKALGYRMRGSCGSDIALETVNPSRAFLTIDSGFPLSELERDLRANRKFELDYSPTPVPVLFDTNFWTNTAGKQGADFLDVFLSDPSLGRLYLGMSHLDSATLEVVKTQVPVTSLRANAAVLDFYGGMFEVKDGAAVVPGSGKAWSSLLGVSPSNPGKFFDRLMTMDNGWAAGYFDALRRIDDQQVAAYLTEPGRLQRLYDALRGRISSPGPARPVFRSTTDLMLLTNGLKLDSDGKLHIPGGLAPWRTYIAKQSKGKLDPKVIRAAAGWHNPDDLVEALFALSRKNAGDEPLRVFLVLNDIDRYRAHPLSTEMTAKLIGKYKTYGAQYRLFADSPYVSEGGMDKFLEMAAAIDGMRDQMLKTDTAGSAQSLLEIWSIFARENMMPGPAQDETFSTITTAFAGVKQPVDIFTASRTSLNTLLAQTKSDAGGSMQQRLLTALNGNMRGAINGIPSPAERFARLFDAQELISVDALFAANDALAKGVAVDPKSASAINQQLDRLRETADLHESLSSDEKAASGNEAYWSGRHLTSERKLDLAAAAKSPDKREPREALAGLLRDSLLGTVYCYYAPAAAQILNTNPLFVRNHDFIGYMGQTAYWSETEVSSPGWPSSQGGRLMGSLIALPYALAQAEQNFMSPKKEQALIWGDLAPQIVIGITVPGWHNITPTQVRWVAAHFRRGQDLIATAALDPSVRPAVEASLKRHLLPGEVDRISRRLEAGDFARAASQIPPAVLYAIADDPQLAQAAPDLASQQIADLTKQSRPELQADEIALAFGTPKPTLTHSYRPALQYVRTFPALMGYSSRILAETWESNNIYYAVIADAAGVPANELDTYVPEWNRSAIENIFAANLEDWPALIRSLYATSDAVLHRGAGPEQALADFPAR